MKKIAITNNVEIILSQNEFGYDTILNDFASTKRISIVTFNISNENIELISKLKQLEDVQIQIVTNIPSRFGQYYYHKDDKYKKDASKRINKYLDSLDPKTFKSDTSVYFNFKNHSKIMATDNYAYIGSANFSSESSNNFESGVLISDSNIVNQIHSEFVSEIIAQSNEYFGQNTLDDFILLVDEFLTEIERFDELYLANVFNRYLSEKQGEKSFDIKFNKLNFKDFDNFRFYSSWFIEELESLSSALQNHLDQDSSLILENIRKLISENNNLKEFAKFNEDGFFQSSFEDLLEYDNGENTDELLQVSLENTELKKGDLIELANSHLIILDDFTQELLQIVTDLSSKLSILSKREKEIDNTK